MTIYYSFEDLETEELIDKLVKSGYRDLVELMLDNESEVYTKSGRLNKSGACRVLGWKSKQLEDALLECKELLQKDVE